MFRFLKEEDVPPYHQVKACIILAAAREENESWENVAAAKHHIKKAEEAFEVAKQTYVHDEDDKWHLEFLRQSIQDERVALAAYERAHSSEPDDDEEDGYGH